MRGPARRFVQHLIHQLAGAAPVKRPHAGQQFEQHHGGGVQIGAPVGGFAPELLGGHVTGRAHRHPVLGQAADRVQPGDAEIGHLHLTIRQQDDVAGLDVAMHHPGGVSMAERLQHLDDHRHGVGGRQRLAVLEIIAQFPSLHVLHDDIGRALLLAVLEHRDDVGMQAAASSLHLAAEPRQPVGPFRALQQAAMDGLNRDRAIDRDVVAQIDHTHGPAAEQAGHAVAADARWQRDADVTADAHPGSLT